MLAGTALFLAGCEIEDVERFVDDTRVIARVGVMADTEVDMKGAPAGFKRALQFFRASGVDAVAIAGKVTRHGLVSEDLVLDRAFQDVFRGTSVRLIVQPGPQEVKGFRFELAKSRPYGKGAVPTFYGGRKLALTDEMCIYPRNSQIICAGSMRGVEIPIGFEDKAQLDQARRVSQGLLVSAYSDRTVIRRMDFSGKRPEDVADPWVLDEDGVVPDPPEHAEFWEDSTVQVLPGYLNGKPIYTVRWSGVQKRHTGARARWYEVTAAFADSPQDVFARRDVLSDGFAFSEARDGGPVKTVFSGTDMPSASERHPEVVFSVTPIGCYGARGRTIVSAPVSLPK